MYDVNDGIWALRGTKVGIAVVHEGMQAPSLMMCSDGIVTALGNFMPEYYADILAAAYRQDWEGVMQYFQKVMNFDIMMRCPGNNGVAKMKYLASLLGIMEPHTSMSTMAVSKESDNAENSRFYPTGTSKTITRHRIIPNRLPLKQLNS